MVKTTNLLNKLSPEQLESAYAELRRLANRYVGNEHALQTLTATGLVHEAFLRINRSRSERNLPWPNVQLFFSAAATEMRRVLVDRARAKKR